ncbi:recombining binding protein suppressor of hairless-like isoform X3 [Sycon ciliatum]|uniref:recombining binding protein suppressor of hairless-like isoform X3 n=1 Tax=Sycon ciliatum TaxID=27933 RepID=UPI0031F66D12
MALLFDGVDTNDDDLADLAMAAEMVVGKSLTNTPLIPHWFSSDVNIAELEELCSTAEAMQGVISSTTVVQSSLNPPHDLATVAASSGGPADTGAITLLSPASNHSVAITATSCADAASMSASMQSDVEAMCSFQHPHTPMMPPSSGAFDIICDEDLASTASTSAIAALAPLDILANTPHHHGSMASDAAAAAPPPAKRARLPPGIQQQHPHHQQLQPGNGLAQCSAAPLSPSSPLFLDSHHQAFISHAQNGGRSPQCVLTREAMQDYLRTRPDCCVTILHAKVAQKSYGNEKRFFCPPPCVYMTGDYWARDQPSSTNGLASPPATTAAQATGSDSHAKTNNTAAGAAAAAGGGADESAADTANGDDKASPKSSKQDDDNTDGKSQEKSKTPPPPPETGYPRCFMGIHEGENGMSQLPVNYKGYSVAKTLFISDSDKRKNFQLAARLIYGDGHDLGSFYSNRIKVISKPSKKKQSVKNAELCIASGTTIALFNRLRSQTVSTRYLHVPRSHFEASSNEWGAFTIHLLPDDEKEDEEFTTCEGFIHYGHTVKLVCTKTGIALPRLVIRKVDKQVALVDADDPVSQLHKVAFYMKDTNRMYLCLSQDRIIQFKATKYQDDDSRDSINDGACWTIISTDVMRYTFHEAMGPVSDPVTPVPRVLSMNMTGCNSQQYVELIGEDFHDNMTVWFADLMVDTFYRCSECILAVVPDPCALDPNYPNMNECLKVPLVIVREDGVVYDTAREYTYPPPMPNTAGGAAAGLAPPPPPSSNLLSMQYRQAPQPPPAAAPLQPEYMLQDHHQQHHRQQHHRHHAGGVGLPAALDIAALGNSTMAAAPPTRPLHYIT